MATIREDFFSALTKGAKWDVGVSINRTNPLPLDQYSVFESETKLDEYIGGAFAYPGQIVAVIGADETKIYYLDQNKAKQPVGIVPSGDSKTIEVTAQGAISLLGAAAAADGTLPMLEKGALVWKTLEDIGAGDGNDNTTYVFTKLTKGEGDAAECYGLSIQKVENGVDSGDPLVIALDVYTKSEIDGKVETINKAISDEAKRADEAEKALGKRIDDLDYVTPGSLEETLGDYVTSDALTTTLGDYATTASVNTALEDYTTTTDLNNLLAAKADKSAYDQTVLDLDALEAKVDAFLSGSGAEGALDSLQELIAYIDAHDGADLTELIATVSAIEGKLVGIDSTVAAYVTAALVPVNEAINGKVAQGDFDALAGRVGTLETNAANHALKSELEAVEDKFDDYTTTEALNGLLANKADTDKVVANDTFESFKTTNSEAIEKAKTDAIADADAKLANKANTADVYAKGQVYTKDEIDDLIEGIEAGSSESAASVNTKLESLKKVLNTEIYGNEEGTGDSRIDALEAVGAQANVIESVVASSTAKITATKEGKTVTIDDKALVADIVAAKGVADGAAAKALANEGNITGLTTRMGNVETKSNENATAIANHATEFATLKGRVDAHDTAIAGKADKSSVEAIAATVGEHTGKFTTLETTTIPALQSAINGKADGTALTDEINRAKAAEEANAAEIAKIPGAIATAKSEAIAEVTALANGAVDANTKAIAKLNGEAGAEGSVATIADARIAAALAGADADFDTLKEMSDWLSTHKDSAAEMNTAILKNAADIKTINETTIPAAITTANGYTDNAIAALGIASYTVKEVVSGHDAITVENVNGKVTIGFADEIVLNGGSAN